MTEGIDKVREEFFAEAQEIIESLSRNLLGLDAATRHGVVDPSLINESFRAVHTLKGLAGLFGVANIGALSHHLEDLLDDLRLGRVELTRELLDLMFGAIDVYSKLLDAERHAEAVPVAGFDRLLAALRGRVRGSAPALQAPHGYALDPGLLAVLTEYEEHRLRTCLQAGMSLFRLRASFELSSLDRALEDIKERAQAFGEIITYLPTGEVSSPELIELDIIVASKAEAATIRASLESEQLSVEALETSVVGRSGAPSGATEPPPSLLSLSSELVAGSIAPSAERSLRSLTQTVRVDIRKLDRLMNTLGELTIVRGALSSVSERLRLEGRGQLALELTRLYRTLERRLAEMQEGILEVRMVPLGQVFDRLARVVRQIGREQGKEIRLVVTGAETEIDKLMVEELSDPLMHMVRNAIDHGIESAEERRAVGKPTAGTIALNAYQKGNHVMIEVEDDGRGIDTDSLLARARALGRLERTAQGDLSRNEVLGLIFVPGLSTREEADDVSGRGVGMDVVKTNIQRLGGVIDLESETGIGTKITITLPITLAIVGALLVEVAGSTFAIPLNNVVEALTLDTRAVRVVEGHEVMSLRERSFPLCRPERLFGLPESSSSESRFVVVVAAGQRKLGLVVDGLIGQQDIIIKPLGQSLARVRGFSGAMELGDQRVALVLDASGLVEEVLAASDGGAQRAMVPHG